MIIYATELERRYFHNVGGDPISTKSPFVEAIKASRKGTKLTSAIIQDEDDGDDEHEHEHHHHHHDDKSKDFVKKVLDDEKKSDLQKIAELGAHFVTGNEGSLQSVMTRDSATAGIFALSSLVNSTVFKDSPYFVKLIVNTAMSAPFVLTQIIPTIRETYEERHEEGSDFQMSLINAGMAGLGVLMDNNELKIGSATMSVAKAFSDNLGNAIGIPNADEAIEEVEHHFREATESVVILRDGKEVEVSPQDVVEGDILVVKPYQTIAFDGIIHSNIELAQIFDDGMISGDKKTTTASNGLPVKQSMTYMNGNEPLHIQVTKPYEQSYLLSELDALKNRPRAESLTSIQRFVQGYASFVPLVMGVLAFAFSVGGDIAKHKERGDEDKHGIFHTLQKGISRFAESMVKFMACPVLATLVMLPMIRHFLKQKEGIGTTSDKWIEKLSQCDTYVFDRTGPLTEGVKEIESVTHFHSNGSVVKEDSVDNSIHALIAAAERNEISRHPAAMAIYEYSNANNNGGANLANSYEVKDNGDASHGVNKTVTDENGVRHKVIIGSKATYAKMGIEIPANILDGENPDISIAMVTNNDTGEVRFTKYSMIDRVNQSTIDSLVELKKRGKNIIMLTGTDKENAIHTANEINKRSSMNIFESPNIHFEQTSDDKRNFVDGLIKKGKKVAFVCDGGNDTKAASLVESDKSSVAIAIDTKNSGSEITTGVASIKLKDISPLPNLIDLSRSGFNTFRAVSGGSAAYVAGLGGTEFLGVKFGVGLSSLFHEGATLLLSLLGFKLTENVTGKFSDAEKARRERLANNAGELSLQS